MTVISHIQDSAYASPAVAQLIVIITKPSRATM